MAIPEPCSVTSTDMGQIPGTWFGAFLAFFDTALEEWVIGSYLKGLYQFCCDATERLNLVGCSNYV